MVKTDNFIDIKLVITPGIDAIKRHHLERLLEMVTEGDVREGGTTFNYGTTITSETGGVFDLADEISSCDFTLRVRDTSKVDIVHQIVDCLNNCWDEQTISVDVK